MMLFYLLPVLRNALEGDPQLAIIMAYYRSYSTICGQFVDEMVRLTLLPVQGSIYFAQTGHEKDL